MLGIRSPLMQIAKLGIYSASISVTRTSRGCAAMDARDPQVVPAEFVRAGASLPHVADTSGLAPRSGASGGPTGWVKGGRRPSRSDAEGALDAFRAGPDDGERGSHGPQCGPGRELFEAFDRVPLVTTGGLSAGPRRTSPGVGLYRSTRRSRRPKPGRLPIGL